MSAATPIIAYSACCAAGMTVDEAMSAVFAGRTGLAPAGDAYPTDTNLGILPESLPPLPAELSRFDCRQGRLALHAAEGVSQAIAEVVDRWGAHRVAVLVGTSTGGLLATERGHRALRQGESADMDVDVMAQHAFSAAAKLVAERFGVRGPAYSVSTACSSSAKIFGTAKRYIDAGFIDAAVLVGVDTLCQMTVRGFGGLKLLADGQCRPFDADRDGINIGEASAAIVLSRESDDALAGLFGVGEVNGGYHMTHSHPDGIGASGSMREALEMAGLRPADIAAVSAHGTATPANDSIESKAIVEVFGTEVPVFSTKGQTGHTLGACGALEAVISLEALARGTTPGNFGLRNVDPEISANVSPEPVAFEGDFIASNSLAFGDNNVSLIFGRL